MLPKCCHLIRYFEGKNIRFFSYYECKFFQSDMFIVSEERSEIFLSVEKKLTL